MKNGDSDAYDEYFKKQEELGLDFDFMEGKDPTNENDYLQQIKKLSAGEFKEKDANHDGKVTYEEFRDNELASLDALDDKSIEIATRVSSYLMYSLMDQGMGNSDNNGTLSQAEFESLYKNLDKFNGEGMDKVGDGKLTTESMGMPSWLIEKIFDDETINNVIKLAIKGEI